MYSVWQGASDNVLSDLEGFTMEEKLQPVRQSMRNIWSSTQDYLAYSALEGAILGIFDCFTLEDLRRAIEEDWDIWNMPWHEGEEFRYQFKLLSRDPRFMKHNHLLTTENILLWLTGKDGRPLHASMIVNSPGGVEWLGRQIEGIRTGLMESLDEKLDEEMEEKEEIKAE